MNKITILTYGITINGTTFPNNSIIFTNTGNIIEISLAANKKLLYSAIYSDFCNSSGVQYISVQDVFDALVQNNKPSGGGSGGSGDFLANGSVPMTGQLTLVGDPAGPLNPVTKQLFDSTISEVQDSVDDEETARIAADAFKEDAVVRDLMVDADKTVADGITEIYQNTVLTTPRTLTIPLASSVPAGKELIYVDEIGGVTAQNFIIVTRTGSDLINGVNTFVFGVTNGVLRLISDGVSKWTTNQMISYTEGTWVPTWSGFSTNPTTVVAQYVKIGRLCTVFITSFNGISNNAVTTVTLPFTSGGGTNGATPPSDRTYVPIHVMNNNVQSTSSAQIINGQNVLYLKSAGGSTDSFTASGNKGAWMSCTYLTSS